MPKVFSPQAPKNETAGMRTAEIYADRRQNLSGPDLHKSGLLLWKYFAMIRNMPEFADGFLRMIEIISGTRRDAQS